MARRNMKKENDRRQEVLGILIMAFALLVFLSLISYHASDYPNSGSPQTIKNWLGIAGASISHILYVYTIGYSSLIFPFLLFLLGWTIFLQREFRTFLRLCLLFVSLGLFLSTALALPEVIEKGSKYGSQLSGNLGLFFASQLNRFLGTAGSIVVLLTVLLLILISATSWSMREVLLNFRDEMKSLFTSIVKIVRKSIPGPRQKPQSDEKRERIVVAPPLTVETPRPGQKRVDPIVRAHVPPARPEVSREQPTPAQGTVPKSQSAQPAVSGHYQFPPMDLLTPSLPEEERFDRKELEEKGHFLEERLREFDVRGDVVRIQPGPVITRFEIKPAPGVKVSRFVGCQDDLALVMRASRVRVVAPIPGKAAVGIEIPNPEPVLVSLRSVLESKAFQKSSSKLTLALGLTIDGQPFVSDLAEMPHLLVAGATGSGKSVCLNTIITSILYRADPSEVKLVLIDPKKLELNLYRKLHKYHLTTREDLDEEVITTVENAVAVLRSLELEMERRYRILAGMGVRNIDDYNRSLQDVKQPSPGNEEQKEKLPYIIIVVDELADLMVMGAREVEEPITRLAQMSRAVGIHLILATQRPSVDVITGVIKANFPSRIAFQVAAKTDSRTILDRNGADKLLGRGDMLFLHPREPEPIRLHGAFISAEEVRRVVSHIASQPRMDDWKLPGFGPKEVRGRSGRGGDRDELYGEAAKLVIRHQQGSASLLQRRLRIGYARAGRLIDQMEEAGIIGPFDGSKAREVLVDESYLENLNSGSADPFQNLNSSDHKQEI
jgi:S-DNA-T family DNA segregation ATPase FtsK/SpoIIIE